jgi:hypothetical protein
MYSLPKISNAVFKATQKLIHKEDNLLNSFDQYCIGQTALFLQQAQTLSVSSFKNALLNEDVHSLNKIIKDNISAITKERNEQYACKVDEHTVPIDLYLDVNKFDLDSPTMIGVIEASAYAYDIGAISELNESDAKVLAKTIAEIREILIFAMLPEDCQDYSSYLIEYFDEIDEVITEKNYKNKTGEEIRAYCNEHKSELEIFSDDYFESLEDMIEQYVDSKISKNYPSWYKYLNMGIGSKRPFLAIKRLNSDLKSVSDVRVRDFIEDAIASMSAFIKPFITNKAWVQYKETFRKNEIHTDSYLESAFIFTLGTSGYWWDIVNNFGTMLMEAGEMPTSNYPVNTAVRRKEFLAFSDGVHRGGALMLKINTLMGVIETDNENLNIEKAA